MSYRFQVGQRLAVLSVVGCVVATSALATSRPAVVVFPARYRLVQLMFDLSRIESLQLVSYVSSRTTERPILYLWNGRDWSELSLADYQAGTFLRGTPEQAILIGDAATLPPALSGDPVWAAKTARLATLDTTALLNEFGQLFNFSPGKWRWIAQRYNLEIKDLNAERRRYGRYGPPRSKQGEVGREMAIPMPTPTTELPARPSGEQVVPLVPRVPESPALPPIAVPGPSPTDK